MPEDKTEYKNTTKYLLFGVISLVMLIGSVSATAVSVAFPNIQADLNTTLIAAGWVLSINQLVSTAIQPLAGKASDAFGRKRVFMFCLGLFTLGSVLSAMAPNIGFLIFFRLIQAVGGGGFFPSEVGIVSELFPKRRQQMIGLFSSIFPVGQIIGPTLGAWLTESFGWRYIFWFNIPFSLIAIIGVAILLKSNKTEEGSQLDLVGAGLFTGSLSAFMVGISLIGNVKGDANWVFIGLFFVTSILLAVLFLRREGKIKNPLFEIAILKQRPFMAANIYNFLYGVSILGITSLVALYAVGVYNMSTFESGLILTPRSIAMVISSAIVSIYLVRWGYRVPMLIGTVAIALALLFLGLEPSNNQLFGMNLTSTALLIMILAVLGLGGGIAAPASNNACIELMPNRVGTIVGIRGMFRMSGAAIGIDVATLILHSVGNYAEGFRIIFIGFAILIMFTIPLIFAMPKSPVTAAGPVKAIH